MKFLKTYDVNCCILFANVIVPQYLLVCQRKYCYIVNIAISSADQKIARMIDVVFVYFLLLLHTFSCNYSDLGMNKWNFENIGRELLYFVC